MNFNNMKPSFFFKIIVLTFLMNNSQAVEGNGIICLNPGDKAGQQTEPRLYFFEEKKASPTFVTNKTITSKFIVMNKFSKKLNLNNKIVCIENADPGYDFIFNYKINGLITAFGGPNSHMSIRCNEFSVPAAIGVGEKKFQQLLKKNMLYLNCEKKMLSNI